MSTIRDTFISRCIEELIEREGGLVNHPSDKGGLTKYGITKKSFAEYQNCSIDVVSDNMIENLSVDTAIDIYKFNYIIKYGIDKLIWNVIFEQVFDMAVLHGPRTAIKLLQETLGVKADGIIGPITVGTLEDLEPNSTNLKIISNSLCLRRISFLVDIVKKDRNQIDFLGGWILRSLEFYS